MLYNSGITHEEMIGASVSKAYFETGYIVLITDKGNFNSEVEGTCCSHTWIENVEFPSFVPWIIKNLENIEDPEVETPCKENDKSCNCNSDTEYGHEYIQYYGYRITTERGEHLEIDFRNDSNGYYGGYLYWIKSELVKV